MTRPQKTALTDDNNVELTIVDEGPGYSVEDAYRVLAEVPTQDRVRVTPEE